MGGQISHSDVVTAIGSLRAVLAAIDAGELSCSAAYRNRLQGAALALESLARQQPQIDGAAPGSPDGVVLRPSRTHVPFRGLRALTGESETAG